MANHVDYDTDLRIIYVTTAPTLIDGDWTVELDVKIDLYSDGKEDWLSDDDLNKFHFPIRSVGGDDLPGDKALGATFFLASDWKIKPYEADHVFKVSGNLYSEDGTSPFMQTTGTYNIMVINTVSSLVDSTIQQLAEIEYASFNGGVTINVADGFSGTVYPTGTPQEPVDNIDDAYDIAVERGFTAFYVIGDLHLTAATPVLDGYSFVGSGMDRSIITIDALANVNDCAYYDAHVIGTLDGDSRLKGCVIDNLIYVKGYIEGCVLSPGTIVLAGSDTAHFLDCWSGVPGVNTPVIDLGGSGQALALRNYNGGIKLINKSGSESVSIDLNSGQIILDSTVTNGDIVCRGIGKITDNSVGANVLSDDLINKAQIGNAVWSATVSDFSTSDTFGYSFRSMLGLQQHNFRLRDQSYQQIDLGNNNFKYVLTDGTIRVYNNAVDAGNDTNHFAAYTISAGYDSNGNCTSYSVVLI